MAVSKFCFSLYFRNCFFSRSFGLKKNRLDFLFKTHFQANQISKKPLFFAKLLNPTNPMREKMQPAGNSKPPSPTDQGEREKYEALLIKQIESIRGWKDLPEDKQEWAVDEFMDAIGHLFLDYYQFHLDESRAYALKNQSILKSAYGPIITYIVNLKHTIYTTDAMEDPWETACLGRTNIEAFISMFDAPTEILDSDEIQSYMQHRKGNAELQKSLIPKNIPLHHWWWYEKYR